MTEDLLAELRTRTRPLHEALDSGIAFDPATVTRARYVAFLQASLAALAPLEPAIRTWLPSTETATRCECLRADLAELGAAPLLAAPPASVAVDSLAAAFGSAYVMEGSSLGGMVLAERVERGLGTTATRYLRYRAKDTAAAWRAFQAALAGFETGASVAERTATCDTACAAFEHYARSFRAAGLLA